MKFDALCGLPAFGISSGLSCRSVRARAIRMSHGWRRFATTRLVDRGTTRLCCEFTTGGVELEPLHVRRHYRPTIESREPSPATVFAKRSGNSSVWFQCQSCSVGDGLSLGSFGDILLKEIL